MQYPERLKFRVHHLALLVALAFPASAGAGVVLYDNLSTPVAAAVPLADDTWLAASFSTDSFDYELSSVTLRLGRTSIGGSLSLSIFSDAGLEPGSLLGTLTSPGSISSSLADQTFTASGIDLIADSSYWIVLNAPTGSFEWAWTTDNTGTGPGFSTTWSMSEDAGASWFSSTIYPFQMQVQAQPRAVPEPTSFVMMGAGLAGIFAMRRYLVRSKFEIV